MGSNIYSVILCIVYFYLQNTNCIAKKAEINGSPLTAEQNITNISLKDEHVIEKTNLIQPLKGRNNSINQTFYIIEEHSINETEEIINNRIIELIEISEIDSVQDKVENINRNQNSKFTDGPNTTVESSTSEAHITTVEVNTKETCKEGMFCYPKCCPEGELFSFQILRCVTAPKEYKNFIPNIQTIFGNSVGINKPLQAIHRRPKCNDYGPSVERAWIVENGNYYIPSQNKKIDMDGFCVDTFHAPIDNPVNFHFPCGGEYSVIGMICIEVDEVTSYHVARSFLHPVSLFVSCVGLCVIIVSYLGIDKLKKLQGSQGPLLISHASALLFGNIFLFIINLPFTEKINLKTCSAIGVLMHYAFLAAFFWLNVMCYDMW